MSRELMLRMEKIREELESELRDKLMGYTTEIQVMEPPFPDRERLKIQIVLLDPQQRQIAFRRRSEGELGLAASEWVIGDIGQAVEEARSWSAKLEKNRSEIKNAIRQEYPDYR